VAYGRRINMHLAQTIRKYLGWCPNARPICASQMAITAPGVTTQPVKPAGEADGSERIDRGFNLFFGSIRILFRNRQMFWFSFLTGLVLLFSLMTTIALQFFSGIDPLTGGNLAMGSPATLIARGSLVWYTLTFSSQLIAVFCALFLMVGLITCVSLLLSGRAATIREGLSNARSHVRSIAGWAVVFAIVGTVQSVLTNLYPENFSLVVISGIVVVFLYLVTLFVIPIFVFEEKSLIGATMGSLSLFRKTWGEILLCCFFFGLLFYAVAFISLLPMVIIGFPSGDRVSLGVTVALYEFVLLIAIMIGTTVIGILLIGLYTFAKTGRMPEAFLRVEGTGL
jgi:hypothetical protein